MAYSRSAVVNQAKKWIGLKESDGSHKEIINIYNNHTPLARNYKVKTTDSWCAAFVSAVAIKLGYTAIIPTECSCGNMVKLFQGLGSWQENDAYTPQPGDVIFYDWDDSGVGDNTGWPDHVGYVETVSGGYVTAIEGNKNNAVGRRTIAIDAKNIRGYGIPKYDSGQAAGGNTQDSVSAGTSSAGQTVTATSYKAQISTPSGVNLRSGAGTNYAVLKAIPNGETVNITKESGGWGYTSYSGKEGWICLKYVKKVSGSGNTSGSTSGGNSVVKSGQQYANSYAGAGITVDGIRGTNTKKAGVKVLQTALNEDYKAGLSVDGIAGTKTYNALGDHYVKKGETQHMVTACQILLMLNGYDPKGCEIPGIFGSGCEAAVKQYQKDNGLTSDGICGVKTFKSLIS